MEFNMDSRQSKDAIALYVKYMSYIDKRGLVRSDMSPCWRWLASVGSHGYGQIMYNGVPWNAHRLSYYLHNDLIEPPKGRHVCHKCDNKECSNPEHLYVGSPKENSDDVWERGLKVKKPAKEKQEQFVRPGGTSGSFKAGSQTGEANSRAKLTEADVRTIRARYKAGLKYGELKKMAEEYNVSYISMQKIVANKSWTHVVESPPPS